MISGGYMVFFDYAWLIAAVAVFIAILVSIGGIAVGVASAERTIAAVFAAAVGFHVWTILARLPAAQA